MYVFGPICVFGPMYVLTINVEEIISRLFTYIIKRVGPNYYVSNCVIISSVFIVMGPNLLITKRFGPITINAEEIISRLLT